MATGLGKVFGDSEPESDLVPTVDPADIRSVYSMQRDIQARFPGEGVMISADMCTQACAPGAVVSAVVERVWMVGVLQAAEILKPEDEIEDAMFQVLASIPMKRMQVGVVHNGPPFDVQEFVKEFERLKQGEK